MSQHYGLRLPDELAETINSYAQAHKLTRSEAMIQLLQAGLNNLPVVHGETNVLRDDQIQEIVDTKTAYLATAMNAVKHTLESEIEALKAKLEGLETRLGEY